MGGGVHTKLNKSPCSLPLVIEKTVESRVVAGCAHFVMEHFEFFWTPFGKGLELRKIISIFREAGGESQEPVTNKHEKGGHNTVEEGVGAWGTSLWRKNRMGQQQRHDSPVELPRDKV